MCSVKRILVSNVRTQTEHFTLFLLGRFSEAICMQEEEVVWEERCKGGIEGCIEGWVEGWPGGWPGGWPE